MKVLHTGHWQLSYTDMTEEELERDLLNKLRVTTRKIQQTEADQTEKVAKLKRYKDFFLQRINKQC